MKKDMNKTLVIIILILSLIVIGLSSYVIYDKVLTKDNVNNENNNTENKEKEDDNCINTQDLIKVMKDDYNLLFHAVDKKYFGTYKKEGNDYKHEIVLKDKNKSTGMYDFEMKIILTEGIATIKGIYAMFNSKLVLYMQPYQYAGWSGDLKWRREFKVNEDGSLIFVDEEKNMDVDMLVYGDVFKK